MEDDDNMSNDSFEMEGGPASVSHGLDVWNSLTSITASLSAEDGKKVMRVKRKTRVLSSRHPITALLLRSLARHSTQNLAALNCARIMLYLYCFCEATSKLTGPNASTSPLHSLSITPLPPSARFPDAHCSTSQTSSSAVRRKRAKF